MSACIHHSLPSTSRRTQLSPALDRPQTVANDNTDDDNGKTASGYSSQRLYNRRMDMVTAPGHFVCISVKGKNIRMLHKTINTGGVSADAGACLPQPKKGNIDMQPAADGQDGQPTQDVDADAECWFCKWDMESYGGQVSSPSGRTNKLSANNAHHANKSCSYSK
ncbi:hypothetical protein LPJ73_002901, partial [Coemansia sp. RSA 2703]